MTSSLQLRFQLTSAPLVCAHEHPFQPGEIQRRGQSIKTRPSAEWLPKERHCRAIAKEFRRDRFQFRQVVREVDIAIFEQRWWQSENVAFEVVVIRRHGGYSLGGAYVEPAEYYPSSSEWGLYGFTYTDRDHAFAKLRQLREHRVP